MVRSAYNSSICKHRTRPCPSTTEQKRTAGVGLGRYSTARRVIMTASSGSWPWGTGSCYRRRALRPRRTRCRACGCWISVWEPGSRHVKRPHLVGAFGHGDRHRPQRRHDRKRQSPAGRGTVCSAVPRPSRPRPDSADFLCMGYALRHIVDLSGAFREFLRVLKPGGRICFLEITRPEGRVARALLKSYMRGVVPSLAWRSWHESRLAQPDALLLGHHRCLRATRRNTGRPSAMRASSKSPARVELGIFSEYCARKPPA